MIIKNIVRQCMGFSTGFAIVLGGIASPVFAQSASENSIYEAGYNAGQRLVREGFSLRTLEGVPYYNAFLESGDIRTVRVNIPRPGNYVLLVGGDNDTIDLDMHFPQADASDVTFGRTAFINFDVYRSGDFFYDIHMLNCQTINCGVTAVLLKTDH